MYIGSTAVLERMRRGYSKEAFLELAAHLRREIPSLSLSTDVITGFCEETPEEHLDTLEVLEKVQFENTFHFKYSQRAKTHAHRTMEDNVPEDIKQQRLLEIIDVCLKSKKDSFAREIGTSQLVLVERVNPKNPEELCGRADNMKQVIFPREALNILIESEQMESVESRVPEIGEYVEVVINRSTGNTLLGEPQGISSVQTFFQKNNQNN